MDPLAGVGSANGLVGVVWVLVGQHVAINW